MSVATIAWKDLTSVCRSRALWAAVTVLGLGTAVAVYGYEVYQASPRAAMYQLLGQVTTGLAVLIPIVALVASYLSIASERQSGGIKFLLSAPNTRRDVFLGKLRSRLTLVAGVVCLMFAAATSVAVAKHGVLPAGSVAGLLVVSVVYAAVFVGIAVALSAGIQARSRAIAAAVGSYLALVILYIVPGVGVSDVVRWFHVTMLDLQPNPDLYGAVKYTSPYVAYQKATNLLLPPDQQARVFGREAATLPVYLSDEFSLVVFAAWLTIPLILGYRRFDRADLD